MVYATYRQTTMQYGNKRKNNMTDDVIHMTKWVFMSFIGGFVALTYCRPKYHIYVRNYHKLRTRILRNKNSPNFTNFKMTHNFTDKIRCEL